MENQFEFREVVGGVVGLGGGYLFFGVFQGFGVQVWGQQLVFFGRWCGLCIFVSFSFVVKVFRWVCFGESRRGLGVFGDWDFFEFFELGLVSWLVGIRVGYYY